MRSLAIAVEPPLLGSSLAAVFGAMFDVVVCTEDTLQLHAADVAIVNGRPRPGITAGTVISLPDTEGNGGLALIHRGDVVTPVEIRGLGDLLRAVTALPA